MSIVACEECGKICELSELTDVGDGYFCTVCADKVLNKQDGVLIARYLCANCLQTFDATDLLELDGKYFCESCRKRRTDHGE